MKRLIYTVLLTLAVAYAHALPMNVKCVGKATQVVNGGDTLFIFKDNIELQSLIGAADWYSTADASTPVLTNTAYAGTLDDGGYYLKQGGVVYEPFYVFRLRPEDLSMSVRPTCGNTLLYLDGTTDAYVYTRPDGSAGTYARTCSVEYNALSWNGEAWADSLVHDSLRLASTMYLPPLYGGTQISLCYDAELREKLELDSVCISDTLQADSVIAASFMLTSLATARENDPHGNNEMNRPTKQDIITSSTSEDYSGALEVAFFSNPTPAVRFFRWTIYKANEIIATRNDQDIRYTFSEPGSYRVICAVNNEFCEVDSMEMKVNISESYLRVPNVFTPDGNGKNDEFRVAYRSLREFHCWVYNRWGKLVYQWTDPAKGWDGTINGRPAAEGAYFYVIRALGTDAAKDAGYTSKISYNKKKKMNDESIIGVYQLSGDINLLRRKK